MTLDPNNLELIRSYAKGILAAGREYRITYRRRGRTHSRSALRQSRTAADRFVTERLFGTDRPDLTPVEVVVIESRLVGWWEVEDAG